MKERVWRCAERELAWKEATAEGAIAYSAIKLVRLTFAPSRVQRSRVLLIIETDRSCARIGSTRFESFGQFSDQAESFQAFVDAFCDRLARTNPKVEYRLGSGPIGYAGNWVATVFVVMAVIVSALFFWSAGLTWVVVVKALLIAFYLPTLVRYLKRNRPRAFTPQSVPWGALSSSPNFGDARVREST